MLTGANPEFEVLLGCAPHAAPFRTDRAHRILAAGVDWDRLLRAAARHRMLPLLHQALDASFPDIAPEHVLATLRDRRQAVARRNLFLSAELLKLLKLLDGHGVEVLPFKGPMLTASVYGDLSLREFDDLDILIHEPDVRKAQELLREAGYRPVYTLTERQETAYLATVSQRGFQRETGEIDLDLHWNVSDADLVRIDPKRWWEHLEPVSLAGQQVLTIAPEETLLLLCLHGSKHRWIVLEWIVAIAELMRVHPDMDWGRIVSRATEIGGRRTLRLGVLLAHDLIAADPPSWVLDDARSDATAGRLAARVRERLILDLDTPLSEENGLELFDLLVRERWRDKAAVLLHLVRVPRPADWSAIRLPDTLFRLYYVVRPARLLAKYCRQAAGVILIRGRY